jgi:hypothetical protein
MGLSYPRLEVPSCNRKQRGLRLDSFSLSIPVSPVRRHRKRRNNLNNPNNPNRPVSPQHHNNLNMADFPLRVKVHRYRLSQLQTFRFEQGCRHPLT